MSPIKIYLVMEAIDLGGNPVCAYIDKFKAEERIEQLEHIFTQAQIHRLMRDCKYSREDAEKWIKNKSAEYYIEEVFLE